LLSIFQFVINDKNIVSKLFFAQAIFFLGVFIFEPFIIIFLWIFFKRFKYKGDRRLIKGYLKLHLAKYLLMIIFTGAYFLIRNQLFVESFSFPLFILLFMLPHFLWVLLYVKPYDLFLNLHESDKWDAIINEYSITQREKEVIILILEGKSNKEIEDVLFISYSTVKNHLSNIYRKLNIYSRLELSSHISKLLSS